MSLYTDASIITTPNGFKAGKLYSVKPTDGTGDLDVARATTATRVNSAGLIETVGINVPRLDYSNGTCPSILVEPQRTNLFTYSGVLGQASNWGYNNEITIADSNAINPIGVNGCISFTPTATNAEHRGGNITFGGGGYVANDIICATAFIKSNGYNYVKFGGNFGNEAAWYNLSNGTVVSQESNVVNTKIENYGNGWYRLTNVYTFQNEVGNSFLYFNITPAPSANTVYTANGTSGILAFGGQIEKNASYPTSYIPTVASTVTRNADGISKTGLPNSDMSFTAILKLDEPTLGTSDGNWLQINASQIDGRAFGYANAIGFADSYSLASNSATEKNICWKQESGTTAKIFLDGVLTGTSTTGIYSNPFNVFLINGANLTKPLRINNFIFYNDSLTDAECIALTTL